MVVQNTSRILGIGDACIDLLIPVSEEFLSQIPGEKGGSQLISTETLHHILGIAEKQPYVATGGSSANTIKGLAALNQTCAFLSLTRCDGFGEQFSICMKKWGVRAFFTDSPLSTTIVLCLITPDGQRTMRFCSGSSEEMSGELLHREPFKGIQCVHLDAYALRRDKLIERSIQLAKQAHAKVSIDLASFEIIREFRQKILDFLPAVEIVLANEKEIKELTALGPYEGCHKLQEMCPIAVVLIGDKGCYVGHQGKIIHSPGFPAQVVDTTGAGDLFASGFLYGNLQGFSLEKCAKLGNRLGSAVVEVTGAELPPEKWDMIKRELENPLF